jgi:uncharacterized protein (TIGR02246 family)
MKTAYIVVFMSLLLSACAQRVNDPVDVQAIKNVNAAWDKAWNAGNAEALASIYTADAVTMGPNQPAVVGRDAIRASCRKYFDQFSEENRSRVEDVRISGDLAVARGTQETDTSAKAGGYSVHDKAKWVTAFQRQPDGSWKVFWEIYNSDLAIADSLPSGMEERSLVQVERDLASSEVKKDWPALDRILGAEYANNTDGMITPKKQFLAEVRNGACRLASGEPGEMKVLVLGGTGIVHGLWTAKSARNGKDSCGTYRYTHIFAKRDGNWQCVTSYSTKVQ